MDTSRLLETHIAERDALVSRISEVFKRDDRVVAAALTSSIARGEADALSDLDVVVVVADAHIGEFVPARRSAAEPFGRVVWCQEVVANAMPGGSYLGVGFAGTAYPLCTDWYWQPESLAVFPTPSLVLVEKRPVERNRLPSVVEIVQEGRERFDPPSPSPDFVPADPEAARWSFKLAYVWRMSGAVASMLARGHRDDAERWLDALEEVLAELTGERVVQPGLGIDRLRALLAHVESLVPAALERGAFVPSDRSWLAQTVDFMAALIDEGWSSPRSYHPGRQA